MGLMPTKRIRFGSQRRRARQIRPDEESARNPAMARTQRHAQTDLRERVKELTCLYESARLAAQPDTSLPAVLQGIAELLPSAWLYPKIASARIVLDRSSFETAGFREGTSSQAAEIAVNGKPRGKVEVVYREERPDLDQGPFLSEERDLLDAVAREIVNIITRKETEEEQTRLQDQLRHADRLSTLGQLAAGVAHELNEPLGNILGFAQLAKKCPGLPVQARQDIEKILAASLHARDIIKKMLVFARQMPPQKKRVNLNEVVQEGLSLFGSRCSNEGIEVIRFLRPQLPAILADPVQLNQVLVNLVLNALQAMPGGGRLTIKTGVRGDHVFLIVEDTGPGMTKEVMGRIFTPFFTTKDVGQGTGLGLSVTHGIVTSHGGSIQVRSEVGQGTQFEIALPAEGTREAERC